MTHHATNLDLPGEANITTAAGDVATFQSTGANTVQCINYTKADGTSVVGGLDDNSVTLAKMAHGTDGELITYDAAGAPANVAVGTSGHILTSGGAGVAPTFQAAAGGGGLIKILTTSVSSGASSVTIDNIFTSTYKNYKVVLSNMIPATTNTVLWMRLLNSSGTVISSSNYRYYNLGSEVYSGSGGAQQDTKLYNTDKWLISIQAGSPSNSSLYSGLNGHLNIYKPYASSKFTIYEGHAGYTRSDGNNFMSGALRGTYADGASSRGIWFGWSSGNFSSGDITVYGYED
jgi:hypothetical protein